MGLLGIWKNALTTPKETLSGEKKNASFPSAIKNLAIGGALGGIIFTLFIVMMGAIAIGMNIGVPKNFGLSSLGLIGILGGAVYFFMFSLLLTGFALIANCINFIVAKILGGKGTFSEQFYLYTIFVSPLFVIVLFPLLIPIIGLLFIWLVGLLAAAYATYLVFLSVKEVHQFEDWKSGLIAAISILLAIGLLIWIMR